MQRTILLADDSPTIRRLVTQTFADADFQIVEVNNGDAAVRTFEEVRPAVVLADIYMPGKNGYQVCAYVRAHSELGKTPVVLLVGAFEAFDEDSAKEAGATASITKPFEPRALIELVTSVMQSETDRPAAAADIEGFETPAAAGRDGPVAPESEPAVPPAAAPGSTAGLDETPVPPPAPPDAAVDPGVPADPDDLFGLAAIFRDEPPPAGASALSDDDVDRIADRVIHRLSAQVVESIAWEVVPDITERIVREELKRVK
jgi:CheY-like chemotaxis protein